MAPQIEHFRSIHLVKSPKTVFGKGEASSSYNAFKQPNQICYSATLEARHPPVAIAAVHHGVNL